MIEFNAVHASRGGREILRGLTLSFPANTTTAILGRSGSGKSTLLRLVNQLLEPTSGNITYNRKPVATYNPLELRRALGFVQQNLGLFPHFTARRQITRFHNHPLSVEALAQSLGLEPALLDRYPHQLSGGQQQRVALARALASNPPVLLLDEPFSALDPILRRELQDLILSLDKTILFVTHDLREALRLGRQLVFLRDGEVTFSGDPAAMQSSNDSEVQAYIQSLDA